jgi:hypothetical protein
MTDTMVPQNIDLSSSGILYILPCVGFGVRILNGPNWKGFLYLTAEVESRLRNIDLNIKQDDG